jgi:hypothetical protein
MYFLTFGSASSDDVNHSGYAADYFTFMSILERQLWNQALLIVKYPLVSLFRPVFVTGPRKVFDSIRLLGVNYIIALSFQTAPLDSVCYHNCATSEL